MKNLSVKYHLEILKCGVSLEGLLKSEVSLEDSKGCFESKVQDGELEPQSNCIAWRLGLEGLNEWNLKLGIEVRGEWM